MSKMMVKKDGLWTPMENLKGDTGPLPADNSVTNDALVTDGAKTNTAYLMGNRLTATSEGEMVSVDDSYPSAALSLTVDGKSTQIQTTGKNLFNNADLSRVGYYEYSTGEYRNSKSFHWFTIPVTAGDIVRHSDITNCRWSFWGEGAYISGSADWVATAPEGADEARGFWSGSSNKGIATKNNADLTYESYSGGAPSPRPDWPQDITNIDALMTAVNGKNIVSPTTVTSTKTSNGISYEWDGEKLNASGTSTVNNSESMQIAIDNAPIMFAGIKYTFSLQGTFNTGASGTTFYFRTSKRGETSQTLRYIFGTANKNSWTYTPTEDMVLRTFTLRIGSSGNTVNISARLQLEIGTTATEYEPYSGNSVTLDLSEEPLRSLPDGTKDELHLTYIRPSTRSGWAFYRGEKVKRVGHEVVTAFDGIGRGSASGGANTVSFYVDLLEDAENVLGRCSHAEWRVASSSTYNYFRVGWIWVSWNGTKRIYMSISNAFNTLALANEWLAENGPVIFDYKKETPETLDLGIFELPAMQSGTTNLWSDPSTNLSITYERDRNIVITNLKAAVADAVTS